MPSPSETTVITTSEAQEIASLMAAIDQFSAPPLIINSRADLDAIEQIHPERHAEFMRALKGSMTRRQNIQEYPEGYGQPGYEGPELEAIWEDVEDLTTIERFGFTKADFAEG